MTYLVHLGPRHYTLIGSFLALVAMEAVSRNVSTWGDVFSPMFVFSVLGQLGVLLKAIGTEPPQGPTRLDRIEQAVKGE